jgi:hypothetical protein
MALSQKIRLLSMALPGGLAFSERAGPSGTAKRPKWNSKTFLTLEMLKPCHRQNKQCAATDLNALWGVFSF